MRNGVVVELSNLNSPPRRLSAFFRSFCVPRFALLDLGIGHWCWREAFGERVLLANNGEAFDADPYDLEREA
jgi:hypothetical protein